MWATCGHHLDLHNGQPLSARRFIICTRIVLLRPLLVTLQVCNPHNQLLYLCLDLTQEGGIRIQPESAQATAS